VHVRQTIWYRSHMVVRAVQVDLYYKKERKLRLTTKRFNVKEATNVFYNKSKSREMTIYGTVFTW